MILSYMIGNIWRFPETGKSSMIIGFSTFLPSSYGGTAIYGNPHVDPISRNKGIKPLENGRTSQNSGPKSFQTWPCLWNSVVLRWGRWIYPSEKMVPSNFLAIFCWVICNLCQQKTSHSTRGGLIHCRQWGYSGWFWDYGLIRKRGMPCFNQPGTVLGSSVNPGCSRSTCKSNCSCKGLQLNNPVHFTNFGFLKWGMALPNIFGIGIYTWRYPLLAVLSTI